MASVLSSKEYEDLRCKVACLTALRSRIIARFTEPETERTEINERLAAMDRATGEQDEPGLLDALPRRR